MPTVATDCYIGVHSHTVTRQGNIRRWQGANGFVVGQYETGIGRHIGVAIHNGACKQHGRRRVCGESRLEIDSLGKTAIHTCVAGQVTDPRHVQVIPPSHAQHRIGHEEQALAVGGNAGATRDLAVEHAVEQVETRVVQHRRLHGFVEIQLQRGINRHPGGAIEWRDVQAGRPGIVRQITGGNAGGVNHRHRVTGKVPGTRQGEGVRGVDSQIQDRVEGQHIAIARQPHHTPDWLATGIGHGRDHLAQRVGLDRLVEPHQQHTVGGKALTARGEQRCHNRRRHIRVGRIGAFGVFDPVGHAIVVQVTKEVIRIVGIQPETPLVVIGHTVSVGVGRGRVEALPVFLQVGITVTIEIQRRIGGVERIQAKAALETVRHAVVVAVRVVGIGHVAISAGDNLLTVGQAIVVHVAVERVEAQTDFSGIVDTVIVGIGGKGRCAINKRFILVAQAIIVAVGQQADGHRVDRAGIAAVVDRQHRNDGRGLCHRQRYRHRIGRADIGVDQFAIHQEGHTGNGHIVEGIRGDRDGATFKRGIAKRGRGNGRLRRQPVLVNELLVAGNLQTEAGHDIDVLIVDIDPEAIGPAQPKRGEIDDSAREGRGRITYLDHRHPVRERDIGQKCKITGNDDIVRKTGVAGGGNTADRRRRRIADIDECQAVASICNKSGTTVNDKISRITQHHTTRREQHAGRITVQQPYTGTVHDRDQVSGRGYRNRLHRVAGRHREGLLRERGVGDIHHPQAVTAGGDVELVPGQSQIRGSDTRAQRSQRGWRGRVADIDDHGGHGVGCQESNTGADPHITYRGPQRQIADQRRHHRIADIDNGKTVGRADIGIAAFHVDGIRALGEGQVVQRRRVETANTDIAAVAETTVVRRYHTIAVLTGEHFTVTPAKIADKGIRGRVVGTPVGSREIDGLAIQRGAGHGQLRAGILPLDTIEGDDHRRRIHAETGDARAEVDAVDIRGIGPDSDFEPVVYTVVVGIRQQRVGDKAVDAGHGFLAVGNVVAIGVGIVDIRTRQVFIECRQTITVDVLERINRIVAVQAVGLLVVVREAVAVTVARRDDGRGQYCTGTILARGDKHRAAAQPLQHTIDVDPGNFQVGDGVIDSAGNTRDILAAAIRVIREHAESKIGLVTV